MKLVLLLGLAVSALAQAPQVEQIMSRVAINQARSLEARQQWIYTQKQHLILRRGTGKVAREERREYAIVPKTRGFDKKLTRFGGRYAAAHGDFVAYGEPRYKYKNTDIDGDLIDGMSKDMTTDGGSRDGIARGLFPLTYHEQLKYTFRLVSSETYRGRPVYRVSFEPRCKPHLADADDGGASIWKGEALIDAQEFQPVLVTTSMALKIPFAVKTLLGTNATGLGFAVEYRKFADGVWFPVSYGGEFEIRAVFFYKRKISVAVVNSDFRRTDVNSTVAYAGEDQ